MNASLLTIISRTSKIVMMTLFIFVCGSAGLRARAEENVWIINSDRGVSVYHAAEQAFKETWPGTTVDIDLGRLTLSQGEVNRRMARNPPDAVYCIGSKAYLIAQQLLKDKPIVLSSVINWDNLSSNRNDMVVASELPIQMQLTLFRHIFPKVQRIGILYSPHYHEAWINEVKEAGRELNLQIASVVVTESDQTLGAAKTLLTEVDALWLIADPVILGWADTTRELFALAHAAGKPVFTYSAAFVDLGATLIIAPDNETVGRQAAGMLIDLNAESPTGKRVQYPAGSEIILNLQKARNYGVEFNQDALNAVNRFIEPGKK